MTIFLNLLLVLFLLFLLFYILYVYYFHRGAVYYPSNKKAANVMLDLAKATKKDIVVDYGSGDGVLLFEAAKRGIKAVGYELDPLLVHQSREKARKLGLSSLIEIKLESMYGADFNEGTILMFYQFPKYLKRFEKLLNKKLKKKVKVVSNRYEIPGRKWDKNEGQVYLYRFEGK